MSVDNNDRVHCGRRDPDRSVFEHDLLSIHAAGEEEEPSAYSACELCKVRPIRAIPHCICGWEILLPQLQVSVVQGLWQNAFYT